MRTFITIILLSLVASGFALTTEVSVAGTDPSTVSLEVITTESGSGPTEAGGDQSTAAAVVTGPTEAGGDQSTAAAVVTGQTGAGGEQSTAAGTGSGGGGQTGSIVSTATVAEPEVTTTSNGFRTWQNFTFIAAMLALSAAVMF